jgi:8-oxo-dGTP pyrophosphatase MutT (NUDIX family)
MAAGRFEIVASEVLHETPVFKLAREVCVHPGTGREHPFYVIHTDDWVNVLPLTDDGTVVLVKQWRQGIRSFCIEIPGGMAEPGERPEQAAARELAEETGYGFGRLIPLGRVTTNPAINDNRCWLFLAAGARPEGPARPEQTEDIEVLTVPLDEALRMVDDGRIDHSMVVNTFLLLRQRFGLDASRILASVGAGPPRR